MDDTELLTRRFSEAAERAKHTWRMTFTKFLDPAEAYLAEKCAYSADCGYLLYGGYEGAERVICMYAPDDSLFEKDATIDRIRIRWNEKFSEATHRDILGAVMALGIERECIGDIVICENSAVLFATKEISEWIVTQLTSCGRASVKCGIETGEFIPPPPKGNFRHMTVPSQRLDAIVSEALNLSRSNANELIKKGFVKKRHTECIKPDSTVNEGDLLSVRGYGRLILSKVEGMTKKGRIGITVFYYENTKNSK